MSEEDALLKAITANPDEDTPRLAYADWLDENKPDTKPSPALGPSAVAEHIRTQCRLAAGGFDDPAYAELLERESDLAEWLRTHHSAPEQDLGTLNPSGYYDLGEWAGMRRGFLEILDFEDYGDDPEETVEELTESLEAAFRESPARTLALEDATTEEIGLFVQQDIYSQLRGLLLDGLYEGEEDDAATVIAEAKRSVSLRRLFFDLAIQEQGCKALAESRYLGNLESLTLDYPIDARFLKHFQNAKWFRNLRRLHLWQGSGDLPRVLSDFPPMPRLTSLTLSAVSPTNPASLRRFVTADNFPRLAHLEISGGRWQPEHTVLLARGKWPLRHLKLDQVEVRKVGCEALAVSPFASTLRVLELQECKITAGGVQALSDCEAFAGLRQLDLANNPIGPGGLAALAGSSHLRGLRSLNLIGTNLSTPIAAKHVVEFLTALDMPELRHLMLTGLPVAVRGARVLGEAKTFSNLTQLSLARCSLGERGTAALLESNNLANLVYLNLNENKVGAAVGKLSNAKVLPKLGHCQLGSGIAKTTRWRLGQRPGVRL